MKKMIRGLWSIGVLGVLASLLVIFSVLDTPKRVLDALSSARRLIGLRVLRRLIVLGRARGTPVGALCLAHVMRSYGAHGNELALEKAVNTILPISDVLYYHDRCADDEDFIWRYADALGVDERDRAISGRLDESLTWKSLPSPCTTLSWRRIISP